MTRRLPSLPALAALAAAALLCVGCLFETRVAGGGSASEETNGSLTGRVAYPDGTPAAGAALYVRPRDFLKDTSAYGAASPAPDAVADSLGRYQVAALPPGPYVVEARDASGRAALTGGDVLRALGLDLSDTLRPVGALEGRLEGGPGVPPAGYVQIFGLDRVARADSAGRFAFRDLPHGTYRLRPVSPAKGHAYRDPAPLAVAPGATALAGPLPLASFEQEDYARWPRTRLLRVNWPGAAPGDTLLGYPLLVRLDSGNFDFGQSGGRDIRFSDAAGRKLRYEVERWDAASRRADIWVRLDTLKAGGQELVLYWGNPDAPDFSSGPAVFAGHAGVWHLQGAGRGPSSTGYPDAALPSAPGEGRGDTRPGDRDGAVGRGAHFGGAHAIQASGAGRIRPAGGLGLSGWIRTASTDPLGGEIATASNNYGLRLTGRGEPYFYLFTDTAWRGAALAYDDWNLCLAKGLDLRDDRWHHLAATWDGAAMRLYVDGEERAATPLSAPIHYAFGFDFWIGRLGGDPEHDFIGTLDEIRFSPEAWSPARVKLDFESQKPGSSTVEFR